MKRTFAFIILSLIVFVAAQAAVHDLKKAEKDIRVDENYGKTIPLDGQFTDEAGQKVTLAQYFNKGIPVVITPVYFSCSKLCTFVLNGTLTAINKEKGLIAGRDYTVLSVSINPRDDARLAADKKKNYLRALEHDDAERAMVKKGWHFLTGEDSQVKPLMNALGFHYKKDGEEYAHTAAIMVLTEKATISRYLYGIQFRKSDFKLALLEAAKGKIGNIIDQVLLYCFTYIPAKRHYGVIAWRVLMIGGGASALSRIICPHLALARPKR